MRQIQSQRSQCIAVVAMAGLGLVASRGVEAQQTPGPSEEPLALEEIVVTSRRIEERLQDTPIAVSAFQTADIEKLSIRNVGDAAAFTPNFVSNPGPTGGNDGFFFIRGVGQTDLNPATDPGVGTYIDGVYLGRVMGASVDSSDIARIEILRGPQGTLFGRNTIGGAINITTRDPDKQFGVDLGAAGGSRDLQQYRASLNVPVTDNSGLLLTAQYRGQNGWGQRASDGELFDTNRESSAWLKYKWSPIEAFTLTISGDVTKLTGTSQQTVLRALNPGVGATFGNSCFALFPGQPLGVCSPLGVPIPSQLTQYVNPGTQPYVNQSSISPAKDYHIRGVSVTPEWKLDWASLKAITAYREMDQFITTDYDSTPYSFYEGGFRTRQHQWSEELQLAGNTGRAKWLLGAFYYAEHNEHTNIVSLGGNNGCLPAGIPSFGYPYPTCASLADYATPGITRSIVNNQALTLDDKSVALFGQTTIKLIDEWSTTLGLRYTGERKTQSYDFFIDNAADVANQLGLPPAAVIYTLSPYNPDVGVPTTYRKSWSELTPKAGLEWHPAENLLYYLSYSRGFKSGGFNGRPSQGPDGRFEPVAPYDPEKMDAYELGAKTQFADNRVRVNVALFQENYKGIQLLRIGSDGFFQTVNAAESRIRGAELELQARPVSAFELQAGVGYTRNQYLSLDPGVVAIGIGYGNQLPMTPEWTASLGAQYTWAVPGGRFSVRSDYSYRSEVFFEATNTPYNRQGGYGLVNARATYELDDGQWSVAAYGLNLANKFYFTNGQDVTGQLGVAFASVSPPREWGAEVRYHFGR
jgi:iron complex outermembrane receptor protein